MKIMMRCYREHRDVTEMLQGAYLHTVTGSTARGRQPSMQLSLKNTGSTRWAIRSNLEKEIFTEISIETQPTEIQLEKAHAREVPFTWIRLCIEVCSILGCNKRIRKETSFENRTNQIILDCLLLSLVQPRPTLLPFR